VLLQPMLALAGEYYLAPLQDLVFHPPKPGPPLRIEVSPISCLVLSAVEGYPNSGPLVNVGELQPRSQGADCVPRTAAGAANSQATVPRPALS
jgi:hypothetical protein